MSPIQAGLRIFRFSAFAAFPLLSLAILPCAAQEGTWTDLFNGKDLTGLTKHGNGTVKVVDGVIDVDGGNGYLHTDKDYTHYRVRVEWKNLGGANSGYLYHINLAKNACDWPSGLEMQMYQGDVGSIYTTDAKFNSTGTGETFNSTGGAISGFGAYGCTTRKHFIRSENKEKVGDWNTWEMFVKGDSMETKVNGTVVMRVSKLTMGDNVPMTKGKMGLQIEGSHVQWRNWQVMDLSIPTVISFKKASNNPIRVDRSGFHFQKAAGVFFDLSSRNLDVLTSDATGRTVLRYQPLDQARP
ncbi:MAG: hypothetical protein JWP91_1842 [Fibrobacteres bacterium]|nr:hypothetical protein [Fibrobacterota bacterium]